MLVSEDMMELKYQEILEYQEVVTNAAINRMTIDTVRNQATNIELAIITSLLLGCCTRVFILSQNHKHPR
ncbi:hypothetical protein N836_21985 [Leptolyngbya sp. Heron Island J]|uniref:hypothetical protein n=1 Tax=Leptolyngbya sp. Heron Island J TaxID=1385935 RepID=UPI0003B9F645|nr:hypothetical protein [Leptolyngbya sp. Heron Island J]ESA33360.1 hypothetical protein N836_21985 [Leptolyngbya sp. Heron Island J]